jgi:cyclic-di-AMP phosphodiesterase PgpH
MQRLFAIAPRIRVNLGPVQRLLPHRNLVVFSLMLGLLLGGILAVPLSRASLIVVGQPSPVTLAAPSSITFDSDVRTRAAQNAAENAVQPIYITTPGVASQQRRALVDALGMVAERRRDPALDDEDKINALVNFTVPTITTTLATTIVAFSDDEWQRITNEATRLYDDVLRERNDALTEADVVELRERVLPYTPALPTVTQQQREVILYFVGSFLRANRVLDQEATEQRRAEARAAVVPIQVSVVRGENIVRRGDIVDEGDFEKLTRLGLVRGAGGWVTTLQMLILGSLVAWLFATYVRWSHETIWRNSRALLIVAALLAVALLAGRLLVPAWQDAPYVFPLATVSVLLTVLFNGPIALVATLALAPLIGLQHEQSIGLTLTLALGGAAGVFTAQRANRTTQFAWVALSVSCMTALAALVFWYGADANVNTLAQIVLFSALNGALSGVLAIGSYHVLGRMSGVVTPLELMELAHPNQPLLRRLMREAPGTYHHSMVVGNLAEVAAENIGADPLLSRVGAYYHDVGKLLRPYFYTDNQHDRSNVHDVLDPKTSAMIIIDHVREGAKLAREYHLPQRVIDFITQHHGTNLVSYFYYRALQQDADIDIEEFRYPGPKPQTRETAILMLADGVEAAVRAKSQAGSLRSARPDENGEITSGQSIAEIVEQIVNERIAANQLDEAPLTLHDLSVIKESFIQTLQGIYHPRVDYPQVQARAA